MTKFKMAVAGILILGFQPSTCFDHLRCVNSNWFTNFMKIGQLSQKLQRKFEILNLVGISASRGDLGKFLGHMNPEVRMTRFYHTKGTSLRLYTYFEPSNMEIGQGVWALQVSKKKVGKTREANPRKTVLSIHRVLGKIGVKRSLPTFAHVFMLATL
jgi:hypothetical protein